MTPQTSDDAFIVMPLIVAEPLINGILIASSLLFLVFGIKTWLRRSVRVNFKENEIIISAKFKLIKSDKDTVNLKKLDASGGRKATQPLKFRSAGSVFKNPTTGHAAGYYIDQAGLKGTKVGDAEISPIHANFFVNHGNAKANDIIELIKIAKKTVKEKFGVLLELELKTLGFKSGTFKV